jgi:uncharacterized protein YaiI (UPF0178 family)
MTEVRARIWIDADACPRDVKELVFRAGGRLSIPVVVVANKAMHVPSSPLVTMVQVKGGPDVADDHIVANSEPGDLTVTADIPLAARLVAKAVIVLNPRGEEYDADNIGERLSVREPDRSTRRRHRDRRSERIRAKGQTALCQRARPRALSRVSAQSSALANSKASQVRASRSRSAAPAACSDDVGPFRPRADPSVSTLPTRSSSRLSKRIAAGTNTLSAMNSSSIAAG